MLEWLGGFSLLAFLHAWPVSSTWLAPSDYFHAREDLGFSFYHHETHTICLFAYCRFITEPCLSGAFQASASLLVVFPSKFTRVHATEARCGSYVSGAFYWEAIQWRALQPNLPSSIVVIWLPSHLPSFPIHSSYTSTISKGISCLLGLIACIQAPSPLLTGKWSW